MSKARALKPKKCNIVFYAATSPTSIGIAQLVKNDLNKIGINSDVKTFPFAVRIAKDVRRTPLLETLLRRVLLEGSARRESACGASSSL